APMAKGGMGLLQRVSNTRYDSIDYIVNAERYFKMYKNNRVDIFDSRNNSYKYKNLKIFHRIWADHIVISERGGCGLFDLEFNTLLPSQYERIDLFTKTDDYCIMATKNGEIQYYDLHSMKRISNPLFN
ncbi:MAG: hypothetical protein AAF806_25675, partial [Bacteroidota bacterium]